jgi:hypothetical protein
MLAQFGVADLEQRRSQAHLLLEAMDADGTGVVTSDQFASAATGEF